MNTFKDYFKNLSIRKKIFYPGLAIIIVLGVLSGYMFLIFTTSVFEREAEKNVATLVNTMSTLTSIYSRSQDSNFMDATKRKQIFKGILEPAKMKKDISFINIYNPQGRLLLQQNKLLEKSSNMSKAANFAKQISQKVLFKRITRVERKGNILYASTPLYLSGIFYGVLVMGKSTSALDSKISFINTLIIISTIFILLIFALVFKKIAGSISYPIRYLAEAAILLEREKFVESEKYLRNYSWSKDETGSLGKQFITMGSRLQQVLLKLESKIELVNADLKRAMGDLTIKHEELSEKQDMIEKELKFAKTIQESLMPEIPKSDFFDIGAKMHVATSVGGDFYSLATSGSTLLAGIGDVLGHGVPSALIMVMMQDAFMMSVAKSDSPEKVLALMNEIAFRQHETGMFTSFFYTMLNPDNSMMIYANAAHNNPLLIRGDKVIELDTAGFMLGIADQDAFERDNMKIQSGDLLFLYTDGLTELRHKTVKDNMLGEEPVIKLLQENSKKSVNEIIEKVDALAQDYAGPPPYTDDLTFVVIKVK